MNCEVLSCSFILVFFMDLLLAPSSRAAPASRALRAAAAQEAHHFHVKFDPEESLTGKYSERHKILDLSCYGCILCSNRKTIFCTQLNFVFIDAWSFQNLPCPSAFFGIFPFRSVIINHTNK